MLTSKEQSELNYFKGTSLDGSSLDHQKYRLDNLKKTLEDYMRISEDHLKTYLGKRDSKNKIICAEDYRLYRDLLYFMEQVKLEG